MPPAPPSVRRSWPFVGRNAERAAIADVLAGALTGSDARGIVLVGPAGIGKSAVAAVAADDARHGGWVTERLVATATSAETALLWASPLRSPTSTAVRTAELLAELEGTVRRRSPHRPMLLVFDDAPALDDRSVDVITHLLRRGRIALLATARSGHPGIGAFNPLFADGTLERLDVAPLDRATLEEAAQTFLGAPLQPAARELLHHASLGIPLFARELLAVNLAAATLVVHPEGWTFREERIVPPTLIDLLTDRCRGLHEAQQRYLETLAAAEPLPASFRPAGLTTADLADLEDLGLVCVTESPNGAVVRLGHPLYADALLLRAGSFRRRDIAERALAAMEHLPDQDPDRALRIATLCVDHELALPGEVLVAAGRRALNVLDPGLAERLLSRVTPPTWDSQSLLGSALTLLGRIDDADDALRRAGDLAQDDEQRARAASRRAHGLGIGGGRAHEALAVLDDACAAITDTRWRSFLDADRACARLTIGETPEVPVQTSATGQARANECLVGAIVGALSGRTDDALGLVDEGLGLVHHLVVDVPMARELLTLGRWIALAIAGRSDEARAVVDTELERSDGRPELAGPWWTARAIEALFDGRADDAVEHADRAISGLEVLDISLLRPFTMALRASALAQSGRCDAAEEALERIEPAWRAETKAQVMAAQARAWILASRGRTIDAATRLARAADEATAAQHATLALWAAHDAVRIGHPSLALTTLGTIADRCQGGLAPALLAHGLALDQEDPDALLAAARELPTLGFSLAGAEAAADASAILERRRRHHDAVKARALAGQLLERAGIDPGRLAMSRARAAVTTLTEREQEIAELAAARWRSREIAEQLGISVRTVDNHLVTVYRKLGVVRRADLAAALGISDRKVDQRP